GLPYQSHAGAFERPFVLSPVAPPAPRPEPRRTPEPARGGVRGFLGSMYSLMFQSRVEQPPKASSVVSRPAASPSGAGVADYPEAIPVAFAANQAGKQPAPRIGPRQERHSTGRAVLITLGIFFAFVFLFLGFLYALARSTAIPMTAKKVTAADLPK